MMSVQTLNAPKRRVFDSVFGGHTISQPTPLATPATGFVAPGQAFGAPPPRHNFGNGPSNATVSSPSKGSPFSSHIEDQVQWDRAWSMVTRILDLPNFPENRGVLEPLKPERDALTQNFYKALAIVLHPEIGAPLARQTEDLLVWHAMNVRNHFFSQVLPLLLRLRDHDVPEAVLLRVVKILETANRQYLHGLSFIKEQLDISSPRASNAVVAKYRRDLHSVVSNSVMSPFSDALRKVLRSQVSTILGLPLQGQLESYVILVESPESEKFRRDLLGLTESFKNVGLAGEAFQVVFAEVMNDCMREYVYGGCRGVWSAEHEPTSTGASATILPRAAHGSSPSRCVTDLCEWIENRYAKLCVQVLGMLEPTVSVSWTDKEKYKEMAIGHLAELRTYELFDIVADWPHSSGALDDLRTAITTPRRRLHLTEVFSQTLTEKLLHPGTSTLQILQYYISMIWSFHALDHSKVLLDRVAYPLQVYVCSREDTVRIIIHGLLADVDEAQRSGDKLVELAQLLNEGSDQGGQKKHDEEMDWHDMEWVPDPVDAGPGYKRSKNADIIGTLIGVLGSQEVFIKEFQNIIGENFLKHDGTFEREIKVLELLKARFGEAPLQACEVMLKDIQDSTRVNTMIRRTQKLDPSEAEIAQSSANDASSPEGLIKPSLHAKILSRLFWPQLTDETYHIPPPISDLQKTYETGFESLKSARKLTWLHALGQATVELEFEDRTIVEEVTTWQATVIWAFESDQPGLQRTVADLEEELEMDETLIRSALRFWVNKLVLHEVSPSTFAVLETLNQEDRARSNAQASAPATSAAQDDDADPVGEQGIGKEKMGIYWQFIQGMLKNSAAQMPLQQIGMMLKMLIVDGFPYSNEELAEFLNAKVGEGELEVVGGKYKLKK